jgi:hypothetical protein
MILSSIVTAASVLAIAVVEQANCPPQTIFDADFSSQGFHAAGWKAEGAWEVFHYPRELAKNPGPVARFGANKPAGSLTKTFPEIRNPPKVSLSLDYGWGWGDPAQAADSIGFELLDSKGSGYLFEVHRTKANWAVQWGKVVSGVPAKDKTWSREEIDATFRSIHDGGGLSRLFVSRESDGTWTISSKNWNKNAGATVRFSDVTTCSFSQLVLLGIPNFDEQVFDKVVLAVAGRDPAGSTAIRATDFLNSIGVNSTFPDRGQPLARTVEMIKYAGFRWVRGGIEGLTSHGPTTIETYLELHRQTGVRFNWGLVSGGTDVKKLIETGRQLAAADALVAFEGNNEPNNWGVTYQGEAGGSAGSWLAVAKLQRDLYKAVKSNPVLKKYPVWSLSAGGAEVDNVGLQFLKIPAGAKTLMPDGTQYADSANAHNYIYHPNSPGLGDNKTWNAADPTSACKVDGLFGNYGVTWAKHFRGYSESELLTLPRVTTETGCTIEGPITEKIHGLNLLSMYLDQFKRGWSHTAVYLLRDRTDEGGNQRFGFFKPDFTPRKAAVYLHNLTTILADRGSLVAPGRVDYSLAEQPATVHDMLLQKSDGTYYLIVWGERLEGTDIVPVNLGGTFPRVKVYDPTIGVEPIETNEKVATIRLTLSDHPVIIAMHRK